MYLVLKSSNNSVGSKICSVEGCGKSVRSNGLCNTHYYRMWRSGSVELEPRTVNHCSVVGCDRKYSGAGYCTKHYSRVRRRGTTELPYVSPICSVDGCGEKRDSLGFCSIHYWRVKKYGEPGPAHKLRQRGVPIKDRLLLGRRINEGTGCWEWTRGTRGKMKYGTLCVGGKNEGVHRLSAHVFHGFDLRSPMLICHSCDNPLCFNPDHLFVGTHKDNSDDKFKKGRDTYLSGEDHPNSKYSIKQVREIRRLRAKGMTLPEISKRTGVKWNTVQAVCSGHHWKNVA